MTKSEKTFMDAVINNTISGKIIWDQPDKDKMRFVSKSDFLLDVHLDIGKSMDFVSFWETLLFNIFLKGTTIS